MSDVRTALDLRLVLGADHTVTVPATLAYQPSDPFAVSAIFHTSDGDVSWVFSRDLLEDGTTTAVGDGDVAIWPTMNAGETVICLSLSSPSGRAMLEANLSDVRRFIDATFAAVPMGSESSMIDLDSVLDRLLADRHSH